MTSSVLFLIAALGVLALISALLRNSSGRTTTAEANTSFLYRRREPLFTAAERSFLGVLDQAVEGRYRVFGKVRLADVLEPQTRSSWQSAFNKLSSKHLDFVLCNPTDLSLFAVIELDDNSHQLPKRKKRDNFLEEAFGSAGVPLLRIPAQASYSINELRASIESLLVSSTKRELADSPPEFSLPTEPATQGEPISRCTKCGGRLVERVSRKGTNAGNRFLGCENYPGCRNVVPLQTPVGS